MKLGQLNDLTILRFTSVGAYLGDEADNDVLLPNKYLTPELEIDDVVSVFLYKDSEDRIVATTETPLIQLNEFKYLQVKEVGAFGAFLDWGLEKDLLVPFKEQRLKLEEGRYYLVTLRLDEATDRLYGSTRINRFMEPCEDPEYLNKESDIQICETTDLGVTVIVDGIYKGIIYHNDVNRVLNKGEHYTGFVYNIREDGKVDVRLERGDLQRFDEAAERLLGILQDKKILRLSDKSHPDEIREQVAMSKKMFKQAIGKLYKARLINLSEDSIELV